MFKLKVLVVDDDPDILDLVQTILEGDYEVVLASNGTEALEKTKTHGANLLILDYNLPDMQGPQICKALRKDPLFIHTPILMLTGKGEIEDKVTGLESGVDDYMVKPFLPEELLARIRMLLRRSDINLDANPLSRLPGNTSINKELEERINSKEKFAVLFIDLDNFKALNDYYGFEKGDMVIKETARLIISVSQEKGTLNDFIGHVGGDDFVAITAEDKAEDIAKAIVNQFDKMAPNFFDEKDRLKGFIETKGRDNQIHKFGFPTISIGIVSNLNQEFSHIAQISSQGAEVKAYAKEFPESKYILDRRST